MLNTTTPCENIQLHELLLQMMETELSGAQVYRMALSCAINPDLEKEWDDYLTETLTHQQILLDLCEAVGVDPGEQTLARIVIRHIDEALVKAMRLAKDGDSFGMLQVIACECLALVETKVYANWELLGNVAEAVGGDVGHTLGAAYAEVAEQKAHHLYRCMGWYRELSMLALGMPAVVPPPQETMQVELVLDASRLELRRAAAF